MPRIPRGELNAHVFHVFNRGNGRASLFHHDGDYRAFIGVLDATKKRIPIDIFSFNIMPNHFHAVMRAPDIRALSSFMQRWMTTHVRRYYRYHGTSGHLWQGRFKSFPIKDDDHLLTVIRYVLQNPVRAHIVRKVEDWPWSGLSYPNICDPWPANPPAGLTEWLNEPLSPSKGDSPVKGTVPIAPPRRKRSP